MTALDVSDNNIKKAGSVHLSKWLVKTSATALHLKNCNLDTESIFQVHIDTCKYQTIYIDM